MRTDPRTACANAEERVGWAIVHDLVCHPLMALTCWSDWSLRFHDWTSNRAWPRPVQFRQETLIVHDERFGDLKVVAVAPGLYNVYHGRIAHRYGVQARDMEDALAQTERWFLSLAELIPHSIKQ